MPLIATRGAASAQGFGEFGAVAGPAVYIEDVFSTYLYTGNGSTQTITNGIDLAGKGGLVWIKSRTASISHVLMDTNRGVSRYLNSNTTGSEQLATGFGVTNFGSTGFTVVDDSSGNYGVNGSGGTYGGNYVSWTFRKQAKFFDVVTWTGNDVAGRTISHSLGSTPGCIIVKCTSTSGVNWVVYHRSLGSSQAIFLNLTNASQAFGAFNYTNPTATDFTVSGSGEVNGSLQTYVAYLFAHNAGGFGLTGTDNVISCGSYTGSTSTVNVNLGWEPQFVLIKCSSNPSTNWMMFDVMRGMPVGGNDNWLQANTSSAENPTGATDYIGPTATGFSLTGGFNDTNNTGFTYIYIAIRRGPMKVPTSGTSVFYPQSVSQTDTPDSTGVPFAPDLVSTFSRNGSERSANFNVFQVADRLRGLGTPNNSYSSSQEGPSLVTSSTGSEISATIPNGQSYIQIKADGRNITRGGGWNSSAYGNWIYYFMRRAPGFFDVVCYTGTGSATTFNHNLAAVPEMMIVKSRNNSTNWAVYSAYLGGANPANRYVLLNSPNSLGGTAVYWNDTAPNSTVFTVGTTAATNASSYSYVAYLFASVAGVSKVGSYTGTGTTKQIDCGFTGGARFVLIKRTDSTGDWYVWDSARGIVAGNDPYLLLNSNAAEVTGTDYVDTYSAGFEISSTAPADINANGGTYIFLAIA